MSKQKSALYQGIVAIGHTKAQAISQYRMLVEGRGAQAITDSAGHSFLSNSSLEVDRTFNPSTGDLDLEASPDILSGMEFPAVSNSEGSQYHYHCSAACGMHMIFNSASFVKHCPTCSEAIASSDDEDSEDQEMDSDAAEDEDADSVISEDEGSEEEVDEDEGSEEEVDEDEVSESTDRARRRRRHLRAIAGSEDDSEEESEDESGAESEEASEDSEDSEDSEEDSEDSEEDSDESASEPLVVAAASREEAIGMYTKARRNFSSTSGVKSVDYLVCASSGGCGAHVVSEVSLSKCPNPSCSSSLGEPVAVVGCSFKEALSMYRKERKGSPLLASTSSSGAELFYATCLSGEGCRGHVLSEVDLSTCPNPGCGQTLLEPSKSQAALASECALSDDDEEEGVEEEAGEFSMDIVSEDEDMEEASSDEDAEDEDAEDEDAEDEASESESSDLTAGVDGAGIQAEVNVGIDSPKPTTPAATELPETPSAALPETQAQPPEVSGDAGAQAAGTVTSGGSVTMAPSAAAIASKVAKLPTREVLSSNVDSATIETDSLEDLPEDASADEMDVSYSSAIRGEATWTAYIKGTPVAKAVLANAGKHADIFGDKRFGMACLASAKVGGVKRVLKELGFKGFVTQISVSSAVGEAVLDRVSEEKSKLEAAQKVYSERLQAALSTAAIGITRRFFANEQNPTREALCSSLSIAGVKNPEVLVDSAMSQSFEPFLQRMFAVAQDLMSKPLEVQESFSRSVLQVSYKQSATASESSAASPRAEDRLSTLGTVVGVSESSVQNAAATSTSGDEDFNVKLARTMSSLGSVSRSVNGSRYR